MKPQELRIGNKIYHREDIEKVEYTIQAIFIDYVLVEETFEDIHIDNIELIPLTEEILLKFGFEKDDDYPYLEINEFLQISWIGYLVLELDGCISIINDCNGVYFHQLQNLYFTLTGEELNMKY